MTLNQITACKSCGKEMEMWKMYWGDAGNWCLICPTCHKGERLSA